MSRYVADAETLPTYFEFDVPSEALELQVSESIAGFTGATVSLVDSLGADQGAGLVATVSAGSVSIAWGSSTPFPVAGLYILTITLTDDSGHSETIAPVFLVIESLRGWLTTEQARQLWPDAPSDPAHLWHLLDAAHTAVIEFAPALSTAAPVPPVYRQAQLMQARSLWASGASTIDARAGAGEYAAPVFPLDWHVKQLLRPKTGVPVIA